MSTNTLVAPPQTVHIAGHETRLKRPTPIAAPPAVAPVPSYYDIPILKRPVWSWEVASYFFLGGLSAGAYVMARCAERMGGERLHAVTQAGTAIATAAALPCAPLLIADLGDPKRFHHMLRVFKPTSPMNLGSWVLTAYSGVLIATAGRQWSRRGSGMVRRTLHSLLGPRVVGAVLDAAGLPLALLLAGYTGVLLSATATPVWCKNSWLGPLFTASALANGVSAITLALGTRDGADMAARESLEKVSAVARATEVVTVAGYLASARDLAKPLTQGKQAPVFWGAVVGLVAGEVLKHLPGKQTTRRRLSLAGAMIGLAGGFALKWAMLHAGPSSAEDPDADRASARPPNRTGARR